MRKKHVRTQPFELEAVDFQTKMDRGELTLDEVGSENVYGTDAQGATYFTKDPKMNATLRKFLYDFPNVRTPGNPRAYAGKNAAGYFAAFVEYPDGTTAQVSNPFDTMARAEAVAGRFADNMKKAPLQLKAAV